jgi:Helix-turn-helix domain
MSLSAQKAAWAATLPAIEKLVMLCLADHADNSGRCWPSIERIGELCGVHRSSVMRSIKALAKGGHISILRTLGRPNHYWVQALDSDSSRTVRPVAESDTSLKATGRQMELVADGDSTSRTALPDQSLSATSPVAQSDPNLLRIYQEPPMNLAPTGRRVKGAVHKPPAFHQEIIQAYHEFCPELPPVKSWTAGRRSSLNARIAERMASGRPADTIEYWRGLFQEVASSDWLCGRAGDWKANLAWLLKPENFAKTIEGNYTANRSSNGARAHG